jgi:hypothetical protein
MDRWMSAADIQRELEDARRREELRMRIRNVQEGIHALTGRSAEAETRLRRQVLLNAAFPSLEFGLGIHSYGDSFAHRRMNGSGTMYLGPLGHAVHTFEDNPSEDLSSCESILNSGIDGGAFAYLGCAFSRRFLHNPHEPDFVNRRQDLYREYGSTLYDIVDVKLPNSPRRLTRDVLSTKLDEVSRIGDENSQIARIRAIASDDLRVPMDPGYRPEEEGANGPLTWSQYVMNHQQNGPRIAPHLLPAAQQTAQQWTNLRP